MAYLTTFYEDVRALISATWTETADNGIYRDVEMANTNLQKKAGAQQLPFAVFTYKPKEAVEWPTNFRGGDGPLGVLYVAGDDVTRDQLTAKLEALRTALDGWHVTNGLVIGFPEVQDSVTPPFLQQFFSSVQRPFIAGAVVARVVTG